MPRLGQNPMKWLDHEHTSERITIMTAVHIPLLADYWLESLDVLKLSLQSILENTEFPFDLMVFDNNSCEEVQDYLLSMQRSGSIDYLILSDQNHRKLGALNFLLFAAPGEIVSFTDSDVYFRPGWLRASVEVLEAFPKAAQVTALPTADRLNDHASSTIKGIAESPELEVQRGNDLIPERFIRAHAMSIGLSWQEYQRRLVGREDVRITRDGISAYASAQDFQFTAWKDRVLPLLPLTNYTDEEFYDPLHSPVLEARLDAAGYWRLSTVDYYAHHIGNKMPSSGEFDWVFDGSEYQKISNDATSRPRKPQGRLSRNRHVRRLLKRINTLTYNLLYE